MRRQPAGVLLADAIEQDIRSARHPPGAVFAFETELQTRHRAGRSLVRQAVRILEQRGIAHMRRGNGGGLVITRPKPEAASRALSIVLESQGVTLVDLWPLLMAMDDHLYLDCAGRVSSAECERLRTLIAHLQRLPDDEFLRVGGRRQVQAAVRSVFGNPAADLAQQMAMDSGLDLLPRGVSDVEERRRGEFWKLTLQMVDALVAGDVPTLFEVRTRQLQMFREGASAWRFATAEDPRKLDDVDTSRTLPESGAERLAREILRDIRAAGWHVGTRLGGAEELMARYGASHNLLRQAVRLLEQYSAVHMQRGRSGGLLIAAPDEAVAMQRAHSFLFAAGTQPDLAQGFLRQLLLVTVREAGSAASRPALQQLEDWLTHARSAQSRREREQELYARLARLSSNPALQLFVRLLSSWLGQHPRRRNQRLDLSALQAMVRAVHAGDMPTARRELLQFTHAAFA